MPYALPPCATGAALTGLVVVLALLAPVIGRYSPLQQNLLATLQGAEHGALARHRRVRPRRLVATALRRAVPTCKSAFLAVLIPFAIGSLLGTLCGYFGGWIDTIVMRVVDIVLAFPFYVLIIALVFFVGEGTHGIYIAFALTDWVVYARTDAQCGPGCPSVWTGWPRRKPAG